MGAPAKALSSTPPLARCSAMTRSLTALKSSVYIALGTEMRMATHYELRRRGADAGRSTPPVDLADGEARALVDIPRSAAELRVLDDEVSTRAPAGKVWGRDEASKPTQRHDHTRRSKPDRARPGLTTNPSAPSRDAGLPRQKRGMPGGGDAASGRCDRRSCGRRD